MARLGFITLVGFKYAHMVSDSSSILENQAHWIILDGLSSGKVGTLLIYMPPMILILNAICKMP